jgi:hypothetical protein
MAGDSQRPNVAYHLTHTEECESLPTFPAAQRKRKCNWSWAVKFWVIFAVAVLAATAVWFRHEDWKGFSQNISPTNSLLPAGRVS